MDPPKMHFTKKNCTLKLSRWNTFHSDVILVLIWIRSSIFKFSWHSWRKWNTAWIILFFRIILLEYIFSIRYLLKCKELPSQGIRHILIILFNIFTKHECLDENLFLGRAIRLTRFTLWNIWTSRFAPGHILRKDISLFLFF